MYTVKEISVITFLVILADLYLHSQGYCVDNVPKNFNNAGNLVSAFAYPGAKVMRNPIRQPEICILLLTTKDEFANVSRWYKKKIFGTSKIAEDFGMTSNNVEFLLNDSTLPMKGKRSVSAQIFHTEDYLKRYSTSITVTKAKCEQHTHVVLVVRRLPPRARVSSEQMLLIKRLAEAWLRHGK